MTTLFESMIVLLSPWLFTQVDLVVHGQTPIMPDIDGADPYTVCILA